MTVADHIQRTKRQSKVLGGGAALFFHALLFLLFLSAGLHPVYPEPQDEGILVEFLPDPQPIAPRVLPGQEPRTPEPTPDRDIRLVQQATQPEVVPGKARTQASTLGEIGEVERQEPPPPVTINRRALYQSRDTGDSLAEQSNRVVSATMQAGPPDGNTRQGHPDGTPSANLPGRNVVGSLPLPAYNTNASGTVVVRIVVDPDGKVTGAAVNGAGTTTSEKSLRDAAVEAALKARFNNVSTSVFSSQQGTITYVFTLK
ncbi:MAG: TonB family protein [Bacteroidetes bacterium]|nr:TonB family protein [Bacteroidota bacterium]